MIGYYQMKRTCFIQNWQLMSLKYAQTSKDSVSCRLSTIYICILIWIIPTIVNFKVQNNAFALNFKTISGEYGKLL